MKSNAKAAPRTRAVCLSGCLVQLAKARATSGASQNHMDRLINVVMMIQDQSTSPRNYARQRVDDYPLQAEATRSPA